MKRRSLLWFSSLTVLLVIYSVAASLLRRPDILPTPKDVLETYGSLLVRSDRPPLRSTMQLDTLIQEGVTFPRALLISTARVLFGLVVGLPLGILIGVLLGWSRRADDYLHAVYILIRSVPPLAFITYIMLWLGHSEAHRLIPIVYAVATTVVIPTYHGVRDVAGKYVVAARSLGAGGGLLIRKVLLPAAAPAVFSGFRYTLAIAWMTAVGAQWDDRLAALGKAVGAESPL